MSNSFNSNSHFAEVRYRLGLEAESPTQDTRQDNQLQETAQNKDITKKWYLRAAENNHPIALFKSSEYLTENNKYPESMLSLFKSAEEGYSEAQYKLGLAFLEGKGCVSQSDNESLKWLRLSSSQQHIKGQELFANVLMKFAIKGNGNAAFELSQLHRDGVGVKKSDSQCARWLEKAVKIGHIQAMMALANMYDTGVGVEDSTVMAFQLYLEAAEKGDVEAQYILGKRYNAGRGVSPDAGLALEWFLKASKQQHAEAQFLTGLIYKSGKGVRANISEATRWMKCAANQGHEEAIRRLARWDLIQSAEAT